LNKPSKGEKLLKRRRRKHEGLSGSDFSLVFGRLEDLSRSFRRRIYHQGCGTYSMRPENGLKIRKD
jgi:hypothetical protein